MRKLITLLTFVLCTTLFAQSTNKDVYIAQHLPLLKENLSNQEYNQFKKSMRFNKEGKLIIQNFNLLEKGAGDQIGVYYQYIFSQRSGRIETISFIKEDGTEMIIAPDGTITNKTSVSTKAVANNEIVENTIRSYTDKEYNVSELVTEDGLFIVTSTGCGPCVMAYPKLNKLTENPAFAKINFVALYRDSFQKINTFKDGSMFQRFGELNEPWVIFSSDELIKKYKIKYDFKTVPFVFIKKDGEIIYQNYGIKIEGIEKELAKL